MTTWRDGTSTPRTPAELELECADILHASQHAPGGTDELIAFTRGHTSLSRLDVFRREEIATNAFGTTTGHMQLSFFTAPPGYGPLGFTGCAHNSASSGLTLARLGVFQIDASDNGLLVARTANDTTMGNAAGAPYDRAFDTAGGFPATWTPTPGQRYAWALLYVGSGVGSQISRNVGNSAVIGTSATAGRPRMHARIQAQADIPLSFTAAQLDTSGSGGSPWGYFR